MLLTTEPLQSGPLRQQRVDRRAQSRRRRPPRRPGSAATSRSPRRAGRRPGRHGRRRSRPRYGRCRHDSNTYASAAEHGHVLPSASCHRSSGREQGRGGRVRPAAAVGQVREVLVAEVLDRAVIGGSRRRQRAERAAEDVVALVEQQLEVGLVALAVLEPPASAPATRCPRGRACTCRRTRACRTPSSAGPRGPRTWSRRRSAARGCRASSRRRRRPRSRGARRGARR